MYASDMFAVHPSHITRRSVIVCIAGLSMAGGARLHAQVSNLNEAINKAGAQRMLSQRMAKAYVALGMGVAIQQSQAVMNASMALFDRQLVELRAFAPHPQIRATYDQLDTAWGQYKTALVGQVPKRESVALLIELDGKVLEFAHQGTVQLEQASGKTLGHLVNLAGRQRMLSQRIAKFYLTQAWKAGVPRADAELAKARAEFVAALDVLERAPEATSAIRRELDLGRQQWAFFEGSLSQPGSTGRAAEYVFVASENLLSVMDTVTGMYARLAS